MVSKVYLGDSVYAAIQDEYVVLTTENEHEVRDTIFLEPEVLLNFLAFVRALDDAIMDAQRKPS